MQARYRVQWLRRMRGVLFLAALSLCALPLLSACSDEGVVASRVKKDSVDVRNGRLTAMYEAELRIEQGGSAMRDIAEETRNIIAQSYLELQQISENTGEIIKPIKQMQLDIAEVKRNTSRL